MHDVTFPVPFFIVDLTTSRNANQTSLPKLAAIDIKKIIRENVKKNIIQEIGIKIELPCLRPRQISLKAKQECEKEQALTFQRPQGCALVSEEKNCTHARYVRTIRL